MIYTVGGRTTLTRYFRKMTSSWHGYYFPLHSMHYFSINNYLYSEIAHPEHSEVFRAFHAPTVNSTNVQRRPRLRNARRM